MAPRWTTLVAGVTLLLLVQPADSFFLLGFWDLFNIGSWLARVADVSGYDVLNPLDNWVLGGGTSIVYNAITLNFLGLKEKIWQIYEVVASYAIFDGLGAVLTVVVNVIAAVAVSVTEILTVIVTNIIETGYRKKLAVIEFLFRVVTGRSFDGVVELARALSEVDDDPK